MLATGVLPKVAGLETSFSNLFRLLIHLLVSILLGMSYVYCSETKLRTSGLGSHGDGCSV